jgi:hypothetical protein
MKPELSGHDNIFMQDGNIAKTVQAYKNFQLGLNFGCKTTVQRPNIGINIINQQGQLIHAFSSQQIGAKLRFKRGVFATIFDIENVLTEGKYTVNIALEDAARNRLFYQQEAACNFKIAGITRNKHSLIRPRVSIMTL